MDFLKSLHKSGQQPEKFVALSHCAALPPVLPGHSEEKRAIFMTDTVLFILEIVGTAVLPPPGPWRGFSASWTPSAW